MMRAFLAIAGAMLLISFLPLPVALIGVVVVLAGCWWLGGHRLGMSIRRRLISDAERQHAALMRGNDVVGVYGRYPPAQPKSIKAELHPEPEWVDLFTYENVRKK